MKKNIPFSLFLVLALILIACEMGGVGSVATEPPGTEGEAPATATEPAARVWTRCRCS